MRTINVCAGIGDNIWLLQKLLNSGEGFHYQLPDGRPQRGKQIFDMLPRTVATAAYIPGLSYKTIFEDNIQAKTALFKDIKKQKFTLCCNHHLETGKRIEEFLPDLKTSFKVNWDTGTHDFSDLPNKPLIGIYGSSYSTQRAWGFWKEDKWLQLIKLLYKSNPDFVFMIIGAEWDLNLGENLMRLLQKENIPYVNTIGKPLGYVTELMKRLKYFFSFPSGLGILAPTVDCPVTMFYPAGKNGAPDYTPMMNTWASQEDIETGVYKGCAFCEPEQIFDWVINHYKLLHRL